MPDCPSLLRSRMRKILLFGLLLFGVSLSVRAQSSPSPLVGPLIAVNTADQAQIILYDVSNSSQRSLKLGNGWLLPWSFTADGCRVIYTSSDGLAFARIYSAKLDGSDRH